MTSGAVTLRAADGSSVRIDRFPAVLGRYHEDAPAQPDCDLSALDPHMKISRRHVSLDWDGARLMVTDLDSSNGSSLDGAALVPKVPTPARTRSVLRLGRVELDLEVETAAPAPPVSPPAGGAASPPPPGVAPTPDRGDALRSFVDQVFRAFSDPATTHVVVEPGRKVRLRRGGEWCQTGSRAVTAEAWLALWESFCRNAAVDPRRTGYITALTDDAVLVEVVRGPEVASPVFLAQRRPAPHGLRSLAGLGALDPGSAEGLAQVVRAGEGVLVAGPPRSGRTALLEALVDHIPHGARIVVVERRPMIRSVSPQVIRIQAADHGAAAVEQALRLSPDWVVVDDALPGAAAAAAWLLPGEGTALILSARTLDPAAWRARAVDILAGKGLDRVGATVALAQLLPISVGMAPAGDRFRVDTIERLRVSTPAAGDG